MLRRLVSLLSACSLVVGQVIVLIPTRAYADSSYPELMSLKSSGAYSDGFNENPSISSDGRYVTFVSRATHMTPDQLNNTGNGGRDNSGFVRDRQSGQLSLVDINNDGVEQNGDLGSVLVSANGRYVFFYESNATNMGIDPSYVHYNQGYGYEFRRDLLTGTTQLISVDDSGNPLSGGSLMHTSQVSYDGNKIVYNGLLRDLTTQTNYNVNSGQIVSVSSDGTLILYVASINGGYNNAIYLRDLNTSQDRLVYVDNNGVDLSAWISNDNKYVFFNTENATGGMLPSGGACVYFPCAYRYDLTTQQGHVLSATVNGGTVYPQYVYSSQVSGDGKSALFTVAATSPDASNNYTYYYPDETQIGLLNIDSSNFYQVGYGPNWSTPQTDFPNYVRNNPINFAISSDGSQMTFATRASNFGPPKNCTVNTEGTVTQEQCADVFATTTAPKADIIPPTGTFTGSTLVLKTLLAQTITGTAADTGSGVASVVMTSSAGAKTLSSGAGGAITLSCNADKTSCPWVANPATLNSGVQTLILKVTDLAGNVYTTTKSYTIL